MHSGVAIWGKKFVPAKVKDAAAEKAEYTYQGHLRHVPVGLGNCTTCIVPNGLPVSKETIAAEKKAGKQHDWNDMEILAIGDRIRFAVNGQAVLDWRDPQPNLVGEGPIALQLHSDAVTELHFKGLVVTTFPEDKLITVK